MVKVIDKNFADSLESAIFFVLLQPNNQNSNKQNGRLPGESLQFVRREDSRQDR